MVRRISKSKRLAYIVGVALGDGNLSNPNGRAVRLRVTCDLKYPYLISKIQKSIQLIFPYNRVSLVPRKDKCLDISCYSNEWAKILGWQVGNGSKLAQKISIPRWILDKKEYQINCLRGLIETDGSIYFDRGYQTVMFTNAVSSLAFEVYEIMISLGFKPNIYKISKGRKLGKMIYRVRLSKNVAEFLKLVKPEKK